MTDYADTRAVLARIIQEMHDIENADRLPADWLVAIEQEAEAVLALTRLRGEPPQEALMGMFILGMIAEREGWPIVGDPIS